MFTIGEFAELNGISAKRLRHYDSIGLFPPAWVDPETRYRYYLAAQIPELRRIAGLVSLGIPLARLRALRAGGSDLADELERRRGELEMERRRISDQLARLEITLERADQHDVVERVRPAGHWATLERPLGSQVGPMFVEAEQRVQRLGTRAARPPVSLRTASTVSVMIPVDEPHQSDDGIGHRWTPATRVATTLVTGGYRGVDEAIDVLVGHVGVQRPEIWLAYLRFGAEPELDLPEAFLVEHAAELVTEIQIAVGDRP